MVYHNIKVKYDGIDLIIRTTRYTNDRVAIELINEEGIRYLTATVNMPTNRLPSPEYTFIKDYSENKGVLAALITAKIVKDTGISVLSGFVEIPLLKITQPALLKDITL